MVICGEKINIQKVKKVDNLWSDFTFSLKAEQVFGSFLIMLAEKVKCLSFDHP